MNKRNRCLSICVTALCLMCLVTGSAFAADADVEQLLFSMAEKMASTKQFSVTMHMGYDVVQESGQKIEFSEIRKVTIDRPNHMRTDAEQSDGDKSQFVFDGKTITLFSETPTDHIAGQLAGVDYQIWIAEDLLPRRIVMTYINAPGQPQFWAEFSDWNLKPEISAKTFVFTPPKGAEKILTLIPIAKSEAASETEGGS